MPEGGPDQGGERPDEILRAFVDDDLGELKRDLGARMSRDLENLTDAHLNHPGEPNKAAFLQRGRNVFDKIVRAGSPDEGPSSDLTEDDQ